MPPGRRKKRAVIAKHHRQCPVVFPDQFGGIDRQTRNLYRHRHRAEELPAISMNQFNQERGGSLVRVLEAGGSDQVCI